MAEAAQIELATLVMGLFGGLALFLFGMDQLSDALKAVAGVRMRDILGQLTKNRITGALTGALVTAVIQSSSVTTVLVVGFITAGLMSLSQSIGIIMGANIGTTITAQIIAFKITEFALALVAVGFGALFLGKTERLRQYGAGLMGLGLVFFGMQVMGDAMAPLRTYAPFLDWMSSMATPAIGIGCGALFTALVQSSSATTGVVIVLASQGLITLDAGIALIFGANVGTCVTAMLASIGKPREALRAAVVHVLFNVAGVLLWLGLIPHLAEMVVWLSPVAEGLTGTARLAADTPRQIANAHTIFNVANTVIFLGLAPRFAAVVERLVPERPLAEEQLIRARFLDEELLSTPSLALDRVRLEIQHQGERVAEMVSGIFPAVLSGSSEDLDRIEGIDDDVDLLHGKIVTYLGRISQESLTEEQTEEFLRLLEATNNLENIGDVIETNLVMLGHHRIQEQVNVSPATREVIRTFHAAVVEAFDTSLQAVTLPSVSAAEGVVAMKERINRLSESAALHQTERLVAAEPGRLPAYTIEMDILQNFKRIYYFCKRMSRGLIPSTQAPSGPPRS